MVVLLPAFRYATPAVSRIDCIFFRIVTLTLIGGRSDFNGRYVPTDARDESCIKLACHWLSECSNGSTSSIEHGNCLPRSATKLPTRVLQIHVDGSCRLVESNGELGEWVALSHRWGASQVLRTTKDNLRQHLAGIPAGSLSTIFKDAISITRDLGFKYIWIDSLCIIQDSEADWTHEALTMSQVHKNASLTLAASHPVAHTDGILARRELRLADIAVGEGVKLMVKDGNRGRFECFIRPAINNTAYSITERASDQLRSRAWALQESILSPRMISWTKEQMIWYCQSQILTEASSDPLLPSQDFGQTDNRIVFHRSPRSSEKTSMSNSPYGFVW